MRVYPELASWDEFYPSEIFIALGATDDDNTFFPILKEANIGATVIIGETNPRTKSTTYKKVGVIEAIADIPTSMVLLGQVELSGGAN